VFGTPLGLIIALPGPAWAAPSAEPTAATPASQDALFKLIDEAKSSAASTFAAAEIDLPNNKARIFLLDDPGNLAAESVLQAKHPGMYAFFSAVQTQAQAEAMMDRLTAQAKQFQDAGVGIKALIPLSDGHILLKVEGSTQSAQKVSDAVVGSNWVSALPDDETNVRATTTNRTADVAPWNGGDFIAINATNSGGEGCSAGTPVHSGSVDYILTAAHCWEGSTASASVTNKYLDNDTAWHGGGGSMGTLYRNDVAVTDDRADISHPTTDGAIVTATGGSSSVDFIGAWNSTSRAFQIGTHSNVVGQQVCESGAYDGQVCSITLHYVGVTRCIDPNLHCARALSEGWNDAAGAQLANGTGNSGGPVYSYSGSSLYAQGMVDLEGGTVVPCIGPAALLRTCESVLYYVDEATLLSHFAVSLNT
jgi:hypothetical protein